MQCVFVCVCVCDTHIHLGIPERLVGLLFAATGISLADNSEKSEP